MADVIVQPAQPEEQRFIVSHDGAVSYRPSMPIFSLNERRVEFRGEHHFIAYDATLAGAIENVVRAQ